MRVGFPEWIYSLGCPGTAEDRSKERILRVLEACVGTRPHRDVGHRGTGGALCTVAGRVDAM